MEDNVVTMRDYLDLRIEDTKDAASQRFDAQQLALKDALISQEKAVSAALEGTKEAISKSDAATDKRFQLLSEKIDGVNETLNKNAGAQGIYVTHNDLTLALDKLQTSIEITLRPVVTFMNSQTGKSAGLNAGWLYLLGFGSLVGMILGVIGFFR